MSAITDARTVLHDALAAVFVAPIGGFAFSDRVHRTQPGKLAAPCLYIGDSAGNRERSGAGSSKYVVTFPVWVVYDGAKQAQVDGLEEVIGRVLDAALGLGHMGTGHQPATLPLDVAANAPSTLRASVVTIEVTVRVHTFCHPNALQETTNG